MTFLRSLVACLRSSSGSAYLRRADRKVVGKTVVAVRLRLAGAGVAGSSTPRLALWMVGPALLRLHAVLLVLRSSVSLLLRIVGVVAVLLLMLSVRVVVSICACTGGSRSTCSGPTCTVIDVLIVVGLLRHFVSHIVHLDLIDVGNTTAFALSTATCPATVDSLGTRLVDVIILLAERKPFDLLGLLGAFAQGQQDKPDQDDETCNTTRNTANDGTEVGAGSSTRA